MNSRTFAAAAGVVAMLAVGSQAFAQAKKPAAAAAPPAAAAPAAAAPAQPAPPPLNYAPAPAGVCVFDLDKLENNSMAGKAMYARLKVIADQASAELTGLDKQLGADYQALQQQQGTLDQNTLDSKAAQLQVRKASLQRLAQQRQAELQKTQQNAMLMLLQAVDPSLRIVFQQKSCAVLFDRSAVLFWNPATDITDAVVANLNTRVQTLNFDRANLSQQFQAARQ